MNITAKLNGEKMELRIDRKINGLVKSPEMDNINSHVVGHVDEMRDNNHDIQVYLAKNIQSIDLDITYDADGRENPCRWTKQNCTIL